MKRLKPHVAAINALEPAMERLSLAELAAKTPVLKEKVARGASLDEVLHEAFAIVREVSRRTLRMRHFDVQLIGGMVLHNGKIAEMKTGEGKTLVATLPRTSTPLREGGALQSPSTTTSPGVTASGWGRSTARSVCRSG